MKRVPWLSQLILLSPETVIDNLERVERAGIVERVPNPWQITLGILRMWHRVLFRSETIGTSRGHAVRDNWRARLLAFRPLRFPFLLAEKAVTPWDFSGLLSSEDRIVAHLLGAHHDEQQFIYDLAILRCHPGALERVRELAQRVVDDDHPRAAWLRDLVVYEGYHENLLAAVERALAQQADEGDLEAELPEAQRDDPDIAFGAYLRWCARQPQTPADTFAAWRRGGFTLSSHRQSSHQA